MNLMLHSCLIVIVLWVINTTAVVIYQKFIAVKLDCLNKSKNKQFGQERNNYEFLEEEHSAVRYVTIKTSEQWCITNL